VYRHNHMLRPDVLCCQNSPFCEGNHESVILYIQWLALEHRLWQERSGCRSPEAPDSVANLLRVVDVYHDNGGPRRTPSALNRFPTDHPGRRNLRRFRQQNQLPQPQQPPSS
jgi:hypothetical protein